MDQPPEHFEDLQPVLVPIDALSSEALQELAREFLLREAGNDHVDSPDDTKIELVIKSLRRQTHFITFDPVSGSAGIIAATELKAQPKDS